MSYNSYDHDNLQPAERLRIERNVYFNENGADLSTLTPLPVERLRAMREESAAAEQVIFDKLSEAAAEWEAQAGQTLSFDKAIEYVRTPPVKHTANQWETDDYRNNIISNMVYKMSWRVSEDTRYDKATQKSVPYATGMYGPRYRWTEKGNNNSAVTSKLVNALHISSGGAYQRDFVRKAAAEQFGVAKEEKVPRGYEIVFHDGQNSYSRHNDWKPNTYFVAKSHRILQANFESRSEALKWVQEFAKQRTSGGKKRFIPEQLKDVRRDGPDFRHGRDATGQDYLNTFGFRGGEFGNWMSQNDRQASLNMGFDALKDLSDALKISDRDISYQGNLSIAFGARGSGNAVAHYEPLRQVINLTKMDGAGSLAHEWWHGLDDYLGTKLGANGMLSENPRKHPLFAKLIDTIKYKPETSEQAAARSESQDARTRHNAESWLKSAMFSSIQRTGDDKVISEYERLKAAFLSGESGSVDKLNDLKKNATGRVIPKKERDRLHTFERLLHGKDEGAEPTIGKVQTEYYKNSKRMGEISEKDGNYWDSNTEMTARAFATYIMDTLPARSDYLAGHAECAVNFDNDADGNLTILRAYPQGEERRAINAVFDEIVAELKLQQYLTHDDRVRLEQQKAPSATQDDWQDIQHEQLTFGNMLLQPMHTADQTPDTSTSVEFFRQGQKSSADKLSLHEYGDCVELHRPDGIERFTPSDGQTAKDVFINQMSELLNKGYAIRVQPPEANDLRGSLVMQELLALKWITWEWSRDIKENLTSAEFRRS